MILIGLLTLLVFIPASRWHISKPAHADNLRTFHIFQFLRTNYQLGALPDLPRIVVKERLGIPDALVNLVALFNTGAPSLVVASLAFSAIAVLGTLKGLVTLSWGGVAAGVLAIAMVFVFPLISCVGMLVIWVQLIFQPSTPGYLMVWLSLGLPTIAASFYSLLAAYRASRRHHHPVVE